MRESGEALRRGNCWLPDLLCNRGANLVEPRSIWLSWTVSEKSNRVGCWHVRLGLMNVRKKGAGREG
jgi:hypothetical protein